MSEFTERLRMECATHMRELREELEATQVLYEALAPSAEEQPQRRREQQRVTRKVRNRVRDHVKLCGVIRKTDLIRDTFLNEVQVDIALADLRQEGVVRLESEVIGSPTIRWIGPGARVTHIDVGRQVRSGRRVG